MISRVVNLVQLINDMPHEDTAKLVQVLRGPYSQRELSLILSVKQQQLSDWERGRTRPNPTHLRALLRHSKTWRTDDKLDHVLADALNLAGLGKYLTGRSRTGISTTKPPPPAPTTAIQGE